jgi:hypothetical protein
VFNRSTHKFGHVSPFSLLVLKIAKLMKNRTEHKLLFGKNFALEYLVSYSEVAHRMA